MLKLLINGRHNPRVDNLKHFNYNIYTYIQIHIHIQIYTYNIYTY